MALLCTHRELATFGTWDTRLRDRGGDSFGLAAGSGGRRVDPDAADVPSIRRMGRPASPALAITIDRSRIHCSGVGLQQPLSKFGSPALGRYRWLDSATQELLVLSIDPVEIDDIGDGQALIRSRSA